MRWLLPVRDPGDTVAERRELKQVLRAAAFDELDTDDALDPRLRATAERMRAAWLTSADEGAQESGDDDSGEGAGAGGAMGEPIRMSRSRATGHPITSSTQSRCGCCDCA